SMVGTGALGLVLGAAVGGSAAKSPTSAGGRATVTVTAAPAAGHTTKASSHPASSKAPAAATQIADGTYRVPEDVKPGTYRTAGDDGSGNCYWARLKGLGGDLGDVLANGNVTGPTVVRIKSIDKGFESSGCKPWQKIG